MTGVQTCALPIFPSLYQRVTARVTGTPVIVGAPHATTSLAARRTALEEFITAAERAQPGTYAVSMSLPQTAGLPITVRTKEPRDWHRIGLNYVYLEPADARIVRNDRFSQATVATQAILLAYPLHFGRFGGRWGSPWMFYGVMVLYMIVGVAPFALMITGLLMYWNRSLSKKWRRAAVRQPSAPAALSSPRTEP